MKRAISRIYTVLLCIGILLIFISTYGATVKKVNPVSEEKECFVTETMVNDDVREFYLDIEQLEPESTGVLFFTAHQYIWVYEDGELIYSRENGGSVFGNTPGGGWNFVKVSPDSEELLIRLEAVYPQVRDYHVSFYQGDLLQVALNILRESIPEVLVSILDFAIGIILMIYYLIASKEMPMGKGLWYFGLFAVMMGAWSLNETEMMTVLVENRVSATYVGYIIIMLMIAPFVLFVRDLLEVEQDKIADIISIVSFVNVIICVVLHMTGIREFKQTVSFTHFLMMVDLAYLLYALMCRVKKHGVDRVAKAHLIGLGILSVAFLVDIVAFYIGARKTDVFGRFGFLFYIILLGQEAARNAVTRINAGRKAEIYKELAVKDVLTGLYNRNAFEDWEYHNKKRPGIGIVTFDLNELKHCNDTYGHAAGDEYIQSAAKLLSRAFEPGGRCYRIGGDEFCTVVENATEKWIDGRIHELEYLERQYNQDGKEVQMHIAHGYAIFDEQIDNDIEDTRSRADVKMYENKKAIKAGL